MNIRELTIADYERMFELLYAAEGVRLRDADSRESVQRYLERNPGLSFVAEDNGRVIGCAMSGHDGRRGYLQHLMVVSEYRRRGTGGALVSRCLGSLSAIGIQKTHIDVLVSNEAVVQFWSKRGWVK